MDIVAFFKLVVEAWQAEQKCGFCWEFAAPLTEAAANKQELRDPCCAQIFLTDYTLNEVRTFADTGFQNSRADNHSFTLWALKQDDIGTNNYNEIKNHPIEESKWETILKPLKDCLTQENLLSFCIESGRVVTEYPVQITNWQMSTKIQYLEGYTGWQTRVTFKEIIQ